MTTRKTTTTELRRCTGSARFGIEPHEAPVSDFPKQPSCGFHAIPITHSTAIRSAVPRVSDHLLVRSSQR